MVQTQYRIKKLTDEEQVRVVTDYNAGMAIPQIEARYGIGRATVYRILKRMAKGGDTHGNKKDN